MKRKKTYLISPKWTLSSLVLGLLSLLIYEAVREYAFPIIVQEQVPLRIQACFTPGQDCQNRIIQKIQGAQHEVRVMCYSFTAKPIAQELVNALNRGVDVKVISDKSQREQTYSQIHWLRSQGVPIWMDDKVAIAHNKVILIDDTTLITGSYNFTNAAEHKNAENILIIESPALVKQYKRNWETRMDASLPFSTESVEKPVRRTRRSAMNTNYSKVLLTGGQKTTTPR